MFVAETEGTPFHYHDTCTNPGTLRGKVGSLPSFSRVPLTNISGAPR